MTPMNHVPRLEDRIEMETALDRVGDVTRDVRRSAEGSPQVELPRLAGDVTEVDLRVRFTNADGHGELTWKTHGMVVTVGPPSRRWFRVKASRR